MSAAAPIAIVGAARTPIGAFLGELKDVASPQLGAHAIEAAVTRAGLDPNDIDEVVMGCVLSAGLGQAPARQAALGAGLPQSTGAVTVTTTFGPEPGRTTIFPARFSTRKGREGSVESSARRVFVASADARVAHRERAARAGAVRRMRSPWSGKRAFPP